MCLCDTIVSHLNFILIAMKVDNHWDDTFPMAPLTWAIRRMTDSLIRKSNIGRIAGMNMSKWVPEKMSLIWIYRVLGTTGAINWVSPKEKSCTLWVCNTRNEGWNLGSRWGQISELIQMEWGLKMKLLQMQF